MEERSSREGGQEKKLPELNAEFAKRLADINFLVSLPKNRAGKVDKEALRK